ncbi:type II toxin-antitoxin system YafQ family toxin [Pseudopedobacter beijingensis]|uniref:Type II toxin-antitoxin system YafQ family toxin n=1 Tax=Pseudopedobacter beijingensis TaxID=1207056 RepID=A0ABW4IAU2_9SPHI
MWECHIQPDWLPIWKRNHKTYSLIRISKHPDLF